MSALVVDKLTKSFGGLRVTRNVNLTVQQGERRLIIGPNGAGKTTLFNLITGELAPDAGSVKLFGREITRLPTRKRIRLSRCSPATPSSTMLRLPCSACRPCAGIRF